MGWKQIILDLIEHPIAGIPARALGRLTWRQSHIAGLINPFHLPAILVNRDGSPLIAQPDTYLFMGSGKKNAIRFAPQQYEPEISYLIGHLIQDTDVVLDIGANVGLHTVAFARKANNGHVYSFEPVSEMAERLTTNVALNGLKNVTLVPCGLGAEDATLDISVNIGGAGLEGTSTIAGSVHLNRQPDKYETRKIPVRRLDGLVEKLQIDARIGFIKIDTEGFETWVIEGGMGTIRKHLPAMVVEAHSSRLAAAGKNFQWYLDQFPEYHILIVYPVNRVNPYLRLEPLTAIQQEIAVNLLFLPRGEVFGIDGISE
tara:strand:- start:1988 stop:2932 length:945 start_codon:yes stop_codon:yes gene_type:complete